MVLHVVEKGDGTVEVLGRAREVEEYGTQCERIVLVGLLPGCRTRAGHQDSYHESQSLQSALQALKLVAQMTVSKLATIAPSLRKASPECCQLPMLILPSSLWRDFHQKRVICTPTEGR